MPVPLYQSNCVSTQPSECELIDTDVLLIIDNTNVIYPSGGVYLEMEIGYSIQLEKYDYGYTMVFLWIIIVVVFIILTGALIVYLCIKIRNMEKVKNIKV